MEILVLSTYNDETYINEAMQAGANGYILKNVESDELIRIIKVLARGEMSFRPNGSIFARSRKIRKAARRVKPR